MDNIKFENDKEELEFYREYKSKRSNQIIEEIHKLLDLDYSYPNGIYLLSCGKTELMRLKMAIEKKIRKLNQRSNK